MLDQACGYSLHVGINRLNPYSRTYQPIAESLAQEAHFGKLRACENDAIAFAHLAIERGFSHISVLLSENATRANFVFAMLDYARKMKTGDKLVLTFSGHGGQAIDHSGDEADGKDEVWCFFDEVVTDDNLFELWGKFAPGVRIIVISDSCHSGDIHMGNAPGSASSFKKMFSNLDHRTLPPIEATVQLMAACRSDQITREKFTSKEVWHGVFSSCLLETLTANGPLTYPELFTQASQNIPDSQVPRYVWIGMQNESFLTGNAFEIIPAIL